MAFSGGNLRRQVSPNGGMSNFSGTVRNTGFFKNGSERSPPSGRLPCILRKRRGSSPAERNEPLPGCTHGCIYCDSRSKCYHIEHDFEDVEVKSNAPSCWAALRKKRKKCMIGTGAMCDPIFRGEKAAAPGAASNSSKVRLAWRFRQNPRFACGIWTCLSRFKEGEKCVVQITLTTFDEDLCRGFWNLM